MQRYPQPSPHAAAGAMNGAKEWREQSLAYEQQRPESSPERRYGANEATAARPPLATGTHRTVTSTEPNAALTAVSSARGGMAHLGPSSPSSSQTWASRLLPCVPAGEAPSSARQHGGSRGRRQEMESAAAAAVNALQREAEAKEALQREAAAAKEVAAAAAVAKEVLLREVALKEALHRELEVKEQARKEVEAAAAEAKEALLRELSGAKRDAVAARGEAAAAREALAEAGGLSQSDQRVREAAVSEKRMVEESLRRSEEAAARERSVAAEAHARIEAELGRERAAAAELARHLALARAEATRLEEEAKEKEYRLRNALADQESLLARLRAAEEAEAKERRRREADVEAEAARVNARWEGELARRYEEGLAAGKHQGRAAEAKLRAELQASVQAGQRKGAKELADANAALGAARQELAAIRAMCDGLRAEIERLEAAARVNADGHDLMRQGDAEALRRRQQLDSEAAAAAASSAAAAVAARARASDLENEQLKRALAKANQTRPDEAETRQRDVGGEVARRQEDLTKALNDASSSAKQVVVGTPLTANPSPTGEWVSPSSKHTRRTGWEWAEQQRTGDAIAAAKAVQAAAAAVMGTVASVERSSSRRLLTSRSPSPPSSPPL